MTIGNMTIVKIDGIDITDYVLDFEIDDSVEEIIDTARISVLNSILDLHTVTLDVGREITISRGAEISSQTYLFRGYITSPTSKSTSIELQCHNKLWLLKQRKVTKSFDINIDSEAGKLSEIIKTLCTTYGGLNADTSSIQDSGTTIVLRKYICRNDEIFERIMKLVYVLNWQFYYNAIDDKVYFEPLGNTTYYDTVTFDNTSLGVKSSTLPILNKDFTNLFNKIIVNGAKQLDTKVDSYSATISQTNFILSFTPQQTNVAVDGTLKVRGTYGSIDVYDYYVDSTRNLIVFTTPLSGGETVVVTYAAQVPTPVIVLDDDSITQYCPLNSTTGEYTPYEKVMNYVDIISLSDAIIRANELLTYYSQPIIRYEFTLTHDNYMVLPGYKINVKDNINNYSGQLIVRKVTRHYPDFFDAIYLSDKRLFNSVEQKDVVQRLEKLEKDNVQDTGMLTHIKNYSRQTYYRRRYMKIQRRDASMDGTWGIGFGDGVSQNTLPWGDADALWQDSAWTNAPVDTQVLHGNNTYEELLYDNDFIDTGTSTMTLNAGTQTLSGAAGQIGYSKVIWFTGNNISQVSITAYFTGNITFQVGTGVDISTSPASWDTITLLSGVATTINLTTPGPSLWYKITCVDAVSFTNNTNAFDDILNPAISITITEV